MSSDIASAVRTGWRLAASKRAPHAVATFDLPIATETGPVALGVDARGDHHLLLPIGTHHPNVEDVRSAHVRVDTRLLVIEGQSRRYVDVVCHRPDLFSTFDEMVVGLLQGIVETPDQVGEVVDRILHQWRELLRPNGGVLGEAELRGLIGELLVLQVLADAGLVGAVQPVWTGPDRAVHDFALAKRRIEVKTVGAHGSTVTIHGLEQLHPHVDRELVLIMIRLEAASEGRCLPELVSSLQTSVHDHTGLRRQLAKAGYADADAERYRDRRYTPSALYAWKIDLNFPRIDVSSIAGGIPEEVTSVEYKLDLTEMTSFAATGRDAEQLIRTGTAS